MAEYIKREAVIDRLKRNLDACNPDTFSELCYRDAIETVKWFPAAEVAPVVRCRECEYAKNAKWNKKGYRICPASHMEITDDDFCSYGVRKDEDKA